jgi:hypothetical protein
MDVAWRTMDIKVFVDTDDDTFHTSPAVGHFGAWPDRPPVIDHYLSTR